MGAGVLALLAWFFSYRLLKVPPGLLSDEAAFGWNATLLSRTGRDENGRFLPVFVLSLSGHDWRQPVAQYYYALFFKLFGASVFNLRFASIVINLASALLLFWLAKEIGGERLAWVAPAVFLTVPLIMIQAHLGLDNNIPMVFALLWLILLFKWQEKKNLRFLFWAGVTLGLGFYSYKGMRGAVPAWSGVTLVYLWLMRERLRLNRLIRQAIVFGLGLALAK